MTLVTMQNYGVNYLFLFVLISDKPSPPRGPASVEWKSDGSMELLWNIPETDGGAVISQYIVERREVGKKSWKQVSTGQNSGGRVFMAKSVILRTDSYG